MTRLAIPFLMLCSFLAAAGCKTFLGTSMAEVEKARATALTKTFPVTPVQAYDAVLAAAAEEKMIVFVKEPARQAVMLLKAPGCLDTSEIGVFCVQKAPGQTQVEISSRSVFARDATAARLFALLTTRFAPPQTAVP